MALDAKEYTKMLTEVKKARDTVDKILDFVDLITNNKEHISGDVGTPTNSIKEICHNIYPSINEINDHIEEELNNIPVNPKEIEDAAKRLLLHQGENEQVLLWAEQQKSNHKENSYWWNYWQGIHDYMSTKKD